MSVKIFSGVNGNHRNAMYADETAIIHPMRKAVPSARRMYAQPFVTSQPIPTQRRRRGLRRNERIVPGRILVLFIRLLSF